MLQRKYLGHLNSLVMSQKIVMSQKVWLATEQLTILLSSFKTRECCSVKVVVFISESAFFCILKYSYFHFNESWRWWACWMSALLQLPGFPEQVSVDLVIVTSVYFVTLLMLIWDIILLVNILPVKVTYMQRFFGGICVYTENLVFLTLSHLYIYEYTISSSESDFSIVLYMCIWVWK